MDPIREDPITSQLSARGVPVTTGRRPDGPESACWVDNDHVAGTRAMLDHLEEEGARRVALLTAPITSSYTIDAVGAYKVWCAERGTEPVVTTIGPICIWRGRIRDADLVPSDNRS